MSGFCVFPSSPGPPVTTPRVSVSTDSPRRLICKGTPSSVSLPPGPGETISAWVQAAHSNSNTAGHLFEHSFMGFAF
ncbi:hypothetical protein [Parabacteroides sp.]|uniref:hypothetical protein n=1 Tax=Parabacteroides sp. TaxID=1869337 RepID=UPI00307FF0F6